MASMSERSEFPYAAVNSGDGRAHILPFRTGRRSTKASWLHGREDE
jgi:hypothetical protein